MSARSSSRSQLVERPKAISLPRLRMSAGRQGFQSRRSNCISKGNGVAAAAARASPLKERPRRGGESVSRSPPPGRGGGGAAGSHPPPAARRPPRPPYLGGAPRDPPPVEVHLPEPVLTMAEALGKPEV